MNIEDAARELSAALRPYSWLQAVGIGAAEIVVYCLRWPPSGYVRVGSAGGWPVRWVRVGKIKLAGSGVRR